MCLTEKIISKRSCDYKEIVSFMKRIFPKEELIPMWLLNIISRKKNYQFSAFYDNGLFIGILFTIETEDLLFIFYLAVNDSIHSKGYGSKLLQIVFERYKSKPITLFIETLDPLAANYHQRVKRFAFYERNGFVNTGIKAGGKSPFVDILSTDKNFTVEQCKKILKYIPLRIYPPVAYENKRE